MEKLVSIVIVNWNGEKFIKECINSLMNIRYKNIEIIVVDNGSTDNSINILESNFADKIKLFKNTNVGYAGGANKGIELAKGDYVLIANPDIVFTEDYIGKLVAVLEDDEKNAACTGKLLKYDFDKSEPINVIDSVGIAVNHKRRGYDIGQNEDDLGQYEEDKRVFAVCGAASLFKKTALEKIKFEDEYFDSDFFAYKEDIDLCWRLNLYGYKCLYIHDAVAYHGRGMNSSKGIINTIRNRKNQSEFLKGISFRNQYLMLTKNELPDSFKKDKIGIYSEVAKYLIFFLFFDFKCFKYIKEYQKLKPKMMNKRSEILKNIKLSKEEVYKLFDM